MRINSQIAPYVCGMLSGALRALDLRPFQRGENVRQDPPIVEMALTMTFAEASRATILDLAELYRGSFQADFPTFQHQPPVPPLELTPVPAAPAFGMITGLELPRLWFVSADTRDLVQIQSDRISYNWRRIQPLSSPAEYPGYAAIKDRFARSLEKLLSWSAKIGDHPRAPQGIELLYVNAIPMRLDGEERRISDVISFYRTEERIPVINFRTSWWEAIGDVDGFVQVATAVGQLPDGGPGLHLTFSARCPVGATSTDDGLTRFDVLHDKIHTIFDRVVTPEIAESARR